MGLKKLAEEVKELVDKQEVQKENTPYEKEFLEGEKGYNVKGNDFLIQNCLYYWKLFKQEGIQKVNELLPKNNFNDLKNNKIFTTPLSTEEIIIDEKIRRFNMENSARIIRENIGKDTGTIKKGIQEKNLKTILEKGFKSLITVVEFNQPLIRYKRYKKGFDKIRNLTGKLTKNMNKDKQKSEQLMKELNQEYEKLGNKAINDKILWDEVIQINNYLEKIKKYDTKKLLEKYIEMVRKDKLKKRILLFVTPSIYALYSASCLNVLIHECSHALAAYMYGFRGGSISVGFLSGSWGPKTYPSNFDELSTQEQSMIHGVVEIAPYIPNIILASVFFLIYSLKKDKSTLLSSFFLGIAANHIMSMISDPLLYAFTDIYIPTDLSGFVHELNHMGININVETMSLIIILTTVGILTGINLLVKRHKNKKMNPSMKEDIRSFEQAYGNDSKKIIRLINEFCRVFYIESNRAKGPIIYPDKYYKNNELFNVYKNPAEIGRSVIIKDNENKIFVKKVHKFFTWEEFKNEMKNDKKKKITKILTKLAEKMGEEEPNHVFRLCQEYYLSDYHCLDSIMKLWNTIRQKELPEVLVEEEIIDYKGLSKEYTNLIKRQGF